MSKTKGIKGLMTSQSFQSQEMWNGVLVALSYGCKTMATTAAKDELPEGEHPTKERIDELGMKFLSAYYATVRQAITEPKFLAEARKSFMAEARRRETNHPEGGSHA